MKKNINVCKPFFNDKKILVITIASFIFLGFFLSFMSIGENNIGVTGQVVGEETNLFQKILAGGGVILMGVLLLFALIVLFNKPFRQRMWKSANKTK